MDEEEPQGERITIYFDTPKEASAGITGNMYQRMLAGELSIGSGQTRDGRYYLLIERSTECPFCHVQPCLVNAVLPTLEQIVRENRHEKTPKELRHMMYRDSVYRIFGFLGQGNCQEIPSCLTNKIKELAPEPSGKYVGFQPG